MKTLSDHDPEQNLGAKTTESMIWFTSLPMLMNVIRFANSILLARLLVPRDFGIVGVASIMVYYTNNLSNFGLGNAIVQRKHIDDDHLNTFFTVNLGISILLCLGFILSASRIAEFFKMKELTEVITIFSSIFIITAFYTVAQTKLRRELGFKAIALNDMIKILISMPVSLLMAFYGFGYWALIVSGLGASLIATIALSFHAKISFRIRYTKKAFRDLRNFASWNFFSLQVRLLSEYVDKLVIGKVSGATTLGYYEKSFGITQMPYEQMANKLGAIAFSTFSRCQSEPDELRYYFRRMLTLLTFLAFPIFIGLLGVSKPFVLVLLGDKWAPMIPSFKILAVAFLVSSLTSLFSTLNITCGNYQRNIMQRAVCLVILVAALPFAARYGITMVAVVVLGHNVLFLLLTANLSRRVVQFSWRDILNCLLPSTAGTALMFLAIKVSAMWISAYSFLNLVLLIVTGITIYTMWFLLTRFQEWKFLQEKTKKIYRQNMRHKKTL